MHSQPVLYVGSDHKQAGAEMAIPLLSIVVVTRNRQAELHRCLRSLTHLSHQSFEIVVIDNASTDGLAEMVAQDFPDVRLFRADRNFGCGVGRNIGARVARGDYIWFIDDDAEVIVPDAAERLIEKLESDPSIGAIGGEAIVDEFGSIIGVKHLELSANGMTMGHYNTDIGADDWPDVRLLAGCNVFLRRADFEAFGGFDPNYKHGWEDTDFAWRMFKSGRRLLIAGFAPVLHHFSGVERQRSLRTPAQSRAYFIAKNGRLPVLLLLPLFDMAYLLNPLNWARIANKARRIEYGAKGRIMRISNSSQGLSLRQLGGAFRVAMNYAATVAGCYAFGWSVFRNGLTARKHAPDGWTAADPIIIDNQVHDLGSIVAAE